MGAQSEIDGLERQLQETFDRVVGASLTKSATALDPELQSDLAKYLCVLTLGFLEEAVERTIVDYCGQTGDHRILLYMGLEIDRWRNPTQGALVGLLGRLDEVWKRRLQSFFTQTDYSLALDSLVKIRHAVVHGQSAVTNLSDAQEYFRRVRIIAHFFLDLVLPRGSVHHEL